MDEDEVERRGPGILLGLVALVVGGLLALFGLMYAPAGSGAPPGPPLGGGAGLPGQAGPGAVGGDPTQSALGSPTLFVLMALGGVVLGGWSSYLLRGATGMVVMGGVISLVSAYNLYGLLL